MVAKRGCKYINSVSTFDFVGLLTLQMPAHSRSSATSLFYPLLKSESAEVTCFCLNNLFPIVLESERGADEASIAETAVHLEQQAISVYILSLGF